MSRTHSQADQLIPPHLIGLTHVTHEQFEELCAEYPDLRLELTSSGELIVMPPTGRDTDRTGVGFATDTGYILPNGAIRGPDVSWMRREKCDGLSKDDKERFAHTCPDFAVELRSPSDRLSTLMNKMEEYIENGASLGWLIDPKKRRVYIFRPGEEVVVLEDPKVVSGDPLLPGFELQMEEIWET
jgi:Uma2 family endonuclease